MRAEAEKESAEVAAQPERKADARPAETKPVAKADRVDRVEKVEKINIRPGNSDSKPPVIDRSAPAKAGADKSQKADNTDEKFTYFLQAGAFREQADAENTRARLALMGFSANIAERQSENGTLYRVRIGPFSQLETMNRMRGKLTDNGVDVAVVRVAK